MSNLQVTNPNVTGRTQDYYAGITQGRIDERERIIKVIEELRIINSDHKFFVIRAIKGEANE